DKLWIKPGIVYVAPANYHLLIEHQGSFALSVDEQVNFSRPSIDVMFESAACAFGAGLVGILLSGANQDGANGLQVIKSMGGLTIAQDPQTAAYPRMPQAAVDRRAASKVLSPEGIRSLVMNLADAKNR
ncbi:MAG: chemotaxis protein CheB, partial [Byssovorax sp.]